MNNYCMAQERDPMAEDKEVHNFVDNLLSGPLVAGVTESPFVRLRSIIPSWPHIQSTEKEAVVLCNLVSACGAKACPYWDVSFFRFWGFSMNPSLFRVKYCGYLFLVMASISKRRRNEALILRFFRYRNEANRLVSKLLLLETKEPSLLNFL